MSTPSSSQLPVIKSLVSLSDFPILNREVHGQRLVYLDNAATTQKPRSVVEAITNYYFMHNANVHRGVHQLGDESTRLFHQSRQKISHFFGTTPDHLVITRNTTEAANYLAYGWGEHYIQAGDVIIATEQDHHSNLVPWQELARRRQARLELITVQADGRLDQDHFDRLLKLPNLKLLAFSHVSNALGTLNPVADMISAVRQSHPTAMVCIDGAQAAAHLPVDVTKLDCDAYLVSAHKMLGPMGMGALIVSSRLLSQLRPALFGGGMIDTVSNQAATFADDPEDRFTAGTPDVAGLVGWAAAIEYLSKIGLSTIRHHDQELVAYAIKRLQEVPKVELVGPLDAVDRVGSVTFVYPGVHAHDVGQVLDSAGIAVRSGHHCTMPLHHKFGWAATTRASFSVYNSSQDVDVLIEGLAKVGQVFGV